MASNKNKSAALSSIKMQAANEVGVPLKDHGYNGDLTAKQAGSVGGQMVKKICPEQQWHFPRNNRILIGHNHKILFSAEIVI